MSIKTGNGGKFTFGSTVVGQVTSISGPNIERSTIDTTNLATTQNRTFTSGFLDPGELSIELMFDDSDSGQVAIKSAQASGAITAWKIEWEDGTTDPFISGTGIVTSFSQSIEIDSPNTGTLSMKITGALASNIG